MSKEKADDELRREQKTPLSDLKEKGGAGKC